MVASYSTLDKRRISERPGNPLSMLIPPIPAVPPLPAVVPGPGDTFASGTFKLKFGRGELCYEVTVTNLSGFIDRIAIYRGTAGFVGSEVFVLSPSEIGIPGLQGCRPIDSALAREISRNPADFYIQVNTTAYPNGALRGQIKK